eukprot:886140-Amphidinium_carterae.1
MSFDVETCSLIACEVTVRVLEDVVRRLNVADRDLERGQASAISSAVIPSRQTVWRRHMLENNTRLCFDFPNYMLHGMTSYEGTEELRTIM